VTARGVHDPEYGVESMYTFVLAFLIGVIAGLRALTPVAVVSWAAYLGRFQLHGTWLSFLGSAVTAYILSPLAVGELIADKLPKTASRKTPAPFATRILSGALCGAAITEAAGFSLTGGLIVGALGAVAGTLGGYEFRARLVTVAKGRDFPIALLEDAIAIGGALLITLQLQVQ
jgi:uncharacterized membrane protein